MPSTTITGTLVPPLPIDAREHMIVLTTAAQENLKLNVLIYRVF